MRPHSITGQGQQCFERSASFSWLPSNCILGLGGELRAQPPSTQTEEGAPGAGRKAYHHLHGLHTHSLESYRELLVTPPDSRTRRTSVWSAPSTPASYTHLSSGSLKEIGQHLGIPFWLPSPLIVFALLKRLSAQLPPCRPCDRQCCPLSQGTKWLPRSRSFLFHWESSGRQKGSPILRQMLEQRHCCALLAFVSSRQE